MKRSALTAGNRAEEILTRTIPIAFSETDVLNVVVRTTALIGGETAELEALTASEDEAAARDAIAAFLAKLIKSWDLEDEDGHVIDVTVDNLLTFGLIELLVIMTAITEELQNTAPKAVATSGSYKRSTKPGKKRPLNSVR